MTVDKITPQQFKAARALLGWKQVNLAHNAGVSLNSVASFEAGGHTPMPNRVVAVRCLEKHGIWFVPNGVTLKVPA